MEEKKTFVQYLLWRLEHPDFTTKLFYLTLLVFTAVFMYSDFYNGKMITSISNGGQMEVSLPNDSLITWIKSKDIALKPGDIVCFEGGVCNHYISSSAENITVRTDNYNCSENNNLRHCFVSEYQIPKDKIEGKVLFVLPSLEIDLMLLLLIIGILYFVDKIYAGRLPLQ